MDSLAGLRDCYESILAQCASVISTPRGTPMTTKTEKSMGWWEDAVGKLPRAELESHLLSILHTTEVTLSCASQPNPSTSSPPAQHHASMLSVTGHSSDPMGEADRSVAFFGGSVSMKPSFTYREYNKLVKKEDYEGNKVINDYTIIGELGRGAYGKVKLAACKDSPTDLVAIKIVNKSLLKNVRHLGNASMVGSPECSVNVPSAAAASPPNPAEEKFLALRREIAIMKKLHHRNIVALHAVIDDAESEKLYLIMDYIPNGIIVKYKSDNKMQCETLDELTVKRYMRQIVDGLRYLHKHGIVHRDIKPDNILVGDHGRVYLSDFGVAEICSEHSKDTGRGTPAFWPPELFDGTESTANPEAHDIWSLGVTLHLMLTGTVPFQGENMKELASRVCEQQLGAVVRPDGTDISHEAEDLVRQTLQKRPADRISLQKIRQHPFLSAGGKGRAWQNEPCAMDVKLCIGDELLAITEAKGAVPLQRSILLKARPAVARFARHFREIVETNRVKKLESTASEMKDSFMLAANDSHHDDLFTIPASQIHSVPPIVITEPLATSPVNLMKTGSFSLDPVSPAPQAPAPAPAPPPQERTFAASPHRRRLADAISFHTDPNENGP